MVARGGEVLRRTLRREPGRNGDEGVVLVGGQIRYPRRILGHVESFLFPTAVCTDIGDVENAVGVLVAVDALGGQGLDVVEDAILERDGVVEGDELVVIVVDHERIREVDGKNANPLGSCWRVSVIARGERAASLCDVHMLERLRVAIDDSAHWTRVTQRPLVQADYNALLVERVSSVRREAVY